jgi:hypothetical protein
MADMAEPVSVDHAVPEKLLRLTRWAMSGDIPCNNCGVLYSDYLKIQAELKLHQRFVLRACLGTRFENFKSEEIKRMSKKYECDYCDRKDLEEKNMASIKENGGVTNKCWACFDKEERDREDAMATLD